MDGRGGAVVSPGQGASDHSCKHWNLESGIPVLLGYCIFCISSTINDTFCVFLLHFVCFALLVQWWKDDNFCSLALDGTIFPISWDDLCGLVEQNQLPL